MSDPTKGPGAIGAFLGVGLVVALLVARFGDPIVAVVIGAVAVGLAIRAATGGAAAAPERPAFEPEGVDPRTYLPVVGGTAFGAVFVEVGPAQTLLCLFPVADPETVDELSKMKAAPPGLTGLVVFNDGPGDHLFGSRVIEAFGLSREEVWATDPTRRLDRVDGVDTGTRQAKRLPERLELAMLVLERHEGFLRARWGERYGRREAVLGVAMPDEALKGTPPTFLVGGVRLDDPEAFAIDLCMTLQHAMLFEGEAAGMASARARFLSVMGVGATVLGARDPEAVLREWLDATREGGEAFEGRIERTPVGLWIDVAIELAVVGEHALASERLAVLAERSEEPRLYFELGISRILEGELEGARAALERAAELGSDIAWNSLANTLAELDRLDEALVAIGEACERMPDDPITFKTAFALRVRAGDAEGAAKLLDTGPFTDAERASLRERLEVPPERAVQRFEGLASIAKQRGTERIDAGDLAGAEVMLRRAVALDPLGLEGWVELAFTLGQREDDEALREVCERAIAEVPGGELLRFNLGNLAIRHQDWDAAREAFEALLEKVPTHRDARVNLVSALCALDRREEAREHVRELEAQGLDRELLEALREQSLDAV